MEFSVAEINFICIVKGDNRKDTINNIFDVLPDLEDKEMIEIAETVKKRALWRKEINELEAKIKKLDAEDV